MAAVRASSAKAACANNLRQIGLALQNHYGSHGVYPGGSLGPKAKFPYLAWTAQLTPFIEQESVWRQTLAAYEKSPRFWMPDHDDVRAITLPVYICSADTRTRKPSPWGGRMHGQLAYLGVSGVTTPREDGLLYRDSKIRNADISDGLSQTLFVGERPPSDDLRFGWWYAGLGQQNDGAGDSVLGVRDCCRREKYCGQCEEPAYHFTSDRIDNRCAFLHFWSLHPRGGNFLFADGSVRFLNYSADRLLPALATRAGGESVEVP